VVTGVEATGAIGGVNVWGIIDASQTSSFSEISTTQTSGFSEISTTQTSDFTEIAA
jgi:hypothetical protein